MPLRPLGCIRRHCCLSILKIQRRLNSTFPETHLPSAALNSYASRPPSQTSVGNAHTFFSRGPVSFLFSAGKLSQFPPLSNTPEIAFLGRSNVGKSSLLNALLNRKNAKLAHESKNPGRTKTMNLFGIGGATEGAGGRRVVKDSGTSLALLGRDGKRGSEVRNFIGKGGLVVVDCPGYGFGSRGEWGEAVMRYLENREQLARVFLLIDVKVGLKKSDDAILKILREAGTPHQIILSKVDQILFPKGRLDDMGNLPRRLVKLRGIQDEIRERIFGGESSANPDVICTSSNDFSLGPYKKIGIGELQVAVLEAAGMMGVEKKIELATEKKNVVNELETYEGVVGWDRLERIASKGAGVGAG